MHGMVHSKSLQSRLFATLWIVAHQVPLSTISSWQEDWSGLSFSSPGNLPGPGIEPMSTTLAGIFLTLEPPGKPSLNSCLAIIGPDHLLTGCSMRRKSSTDRQTYTSSVRTSFCPCVPSQFRLRGRVWWFSQTKSQGCGNEVQPQQRLVSLLLPWKTREGCGLNPSVMAQVLPSPCPSLALTAVLQDGNTPTRGMQASRSFSCVQLSLSEMHMCLVMSDSLSPQGP